MLKNRMRTPLNVLADPDLRSGDGGPRTADTDPAAGSAAPHGAALRASFRRFNAKLYGAMLLRAAIPTIYTSVRIYFLGDLPADSGVNIAAQLVWVNLILEVFSEALILPLYHCIGVSIGDRSETASRVRTSARVTFGVYAALSVALFVAMPALVSAMAQDPEIIPQTIAHRSYFTIYSQRIKYQARLSALS